MIRKHTTEEIVQFRPFFATLNIHTFTSGEFTELVLPAIAQKYATHRDQLMAALLWLYEVIRREPPAYPALDAAYADLREAYTKHALRYFNIKSEEFVDYNHSFQLGSIVL